MPLLPPRVPLLALAVALATPAMNLLAAESLASLTRRITETKPEVLIAPPAKPGDVVIRGEWRGGRWSGTVRNVSDRPVTVREIVLFEGDHGLDPATPVYGESFQMLAQITGTLGAPEDLGRYPDRIHYRIPEPEGYRTAAGVLALAPPGGDALALGFTSCRKFIGRLGFNDRRLRIFLDAENRPLPPGGEWTLESFGVFPGPNRDAVLAAAAEATAAAHPVRLRPAPPTGWCSWYAFYESVTAADITRNLAFARKHLPRLRTIQIDDGYQPRMGDWLDTGPAFGGKVQTVLAGIRDAGFEPAIWVAPFIAEKNSRLLRDHPDWFVKGPDGRPLDSSTVGFGGWRAKPWYVLDGTHPEVQRHLEHVFRTMRDAWGVRYFKLDANYWGAIHGGTHHDPTATRIEAYRRGMEAIRRGAGDSFLLGCNAPMWPSLGLVDGMRTSSDIDNTWAAMRLTARENLARNWQNGRLWWNDPDCIVFTENPERNVLSGHPPPDPTLRADNFRFHAAAIRASGGMALSGDELARIPPERRAVLARLLEPTGRAMRFEDAEFSVGRADLDAGAFEVALFNWDDQPVTRSTPVPRGARVTDLWTGQTTVAAKPTLAAELPPRSAAFFAVRPPEPAAEPESPPAR